jgi:hypothetical protein
VGALRLRHRHPGHRYNLSMSGTSCSSSLDIAAAVFSTGYRLKSAGDRLEGLVAPRSARSVGLPSFPVNPIILDIEEGAQCDLASRIGIKCSESSAV